MNRYLRRLKCHEIFCEPYMTEIRGCNGTFGVRGYRVLNAKDPTWVRYDGSVWPRGTISALIKAHGKKTLKVVQI